MDIKVAVTATFTKKRLAHIIELAINQGSPYWYFNEEKIAPVQWNYGRSNNIQDYPLNPGGALLLRCHEDLDIFPESELPTYRLDTPVIKRGLAYIAECYPATLLDLANKVQIPYEDLEQFILCCVFVSRGYEPPKSQSKTWECFLCEKEQNEITAPYPFTVWLKSNPKEKISPVCVFCHHKLTKEKQIVKEAK